LNNHVRFSNPSRLSSPATQESRPYLWGRGKAEEKMDEYITNLGNGLGKISEKNYRVKIISP
jgi:hypothetical protein